jgi:NTP pyrophosphatase (non-canonical NTP hydrolase)
MNADVQQQVSVFVEQHDLAIDVTFRLLDLVSELGELSKELLKATDYGRNALQSGQVSEHWEAELGDVYLSLICVANATGVDLEQSLTTTLEKYRKRLENQQDAGSGR